MTNESKQNHNSAIGESWEDVQSTLFTPEEIAASDLRVALICELIEARNSGKITQKEFEILIGHRKPFFFGLFDRKRQKEKEDMQLTGIMKILTSMGKTLAVVPLETK